MTAEQIAELRRLWEDGVSQAQIGKAVGYSQTHVSRKASSLGLKRAPCRGSVTPETLANCAKARRVLQEMCKRAESERAAMNAAPLPALPIELQAVLERRQRRERVR